MGITATATELADDVGESPSGCSFHLRKLAEFGYIDHVDHATGAAIFERDVATLRAGHARRDAAQW